MEAIIILVASVVGMFLCNWDLGTACTYSSLAVMLCKALTSYTNDKAAGR